MGSTRASVITHPDNDWATNLNYTQLYAIFTDDNAVPGTSA